MISLWVQVVIWRSGVGGWKVNLCYHHYGESSKGGRIFLYTRRTFEINACCLLCCKRNWWWWWLCTASNQKCPHKQWGICKNSREGSRQIFTQKSLLYGCSQIRFYLTPTWSMGTLEMQTKKIVYTISLLTKKMHLEFRGKRTIMKIASRGLGVGIWFLLTELRSLRGLETFLEFFTLTCLRGNGGMVSLSAASIFDPYFLLISFYFLWHIGPINCVMTTSGVSNVREKGKL